MESRINKKPVERVAWHEAGHAFVLLRMSKKFDFITIKPGSGYHGKLQFDEAIEFTGGMKALADYCMNCFAGHIAEEIYTGLPLKIELWQDDFKKANKQIDRFIKDKMQSAAFARTVYEGTKFAMKSNKEKIKMIARALLEKKTLTYDECKSLII